MIESVGCCAGEGSECRSPREPRGLSIDGASDAAETESHLEESHLSSEPSLASGQSIALVVDKEVTSYLMMGALSPGLKRHAVTLFEGTIG